MAAPVVAPRLKDVAEAGALNQQPGDPAREQCHDRRGVEDEANCRLRHVERDGRPDEDEEVVLLPEPVGEKLPRHPDKPEEAEPDRDEAEGENEVRERRRLRLGNSVEQLGPHEVALSAEEQEAEVGENVGEQQVAQRGDRHGAAQHQQPRQIARRHQQHRGADEGEQDVGGRVPPGADEVHAPVVGEREQDRQRKRDYSEHRGRQAVDAPELVDNHLGNQVDDQNHHQVGEPFPAQRDQHQCHPRQSRVAERQPLALQEVGEAALDALGGAPVGDPARVTPFCEGAHEEEEGTSPEENHVRIVVRQRDGRVGNMAGIDRDEERPEQSRFAAELRAADGVDGEDNQRAVDRWQHFHRPPG